VATTSPTGAGPSGPCVSTVIIPQATLESAYTYIPRRRPRPAIGAKVFETSAKRSLQLAAVSRKRITRPANDPKTDRRGGWGED
jgi:hypothetical protein